jgi:N-methylhydantoinase A
VDTGGTFTDVTLLDTSTGRLWNAKTPSTPDDPSRGFGEGIREVLAASGCTARDVARVLHGTTVATNLILEGKGARAGLITTAGFKYVLEIGRQDVPRRANLFSWVKPRRPVFAGHIHEVPGRIGPGGEEIVPLDEVAVRAAAERIAADGVDAVAIVFLHSYANPAHEQRAAEIIRELLPEMPISISSDVLPVFREYERSMTTILNVHVMPVVSRYVERLDQRLAEQKIRAPLLLMKSGGGVASARDIKRVPVETALSGPAAGAVGAAHVGRSAGIENLIGIDIGGTSADISLIVDGDPGMTTRGHVGAWPVGLAMVDIVTIGAGGGSIARVTETGALAVGPESAGAVPGPVCYRRGGAAPTVTDAHLALGHLPPYLLGGSFRLDLDSARHAIETELARPLGLSVEDAARGVLAIVDNHMVGAMRVVSVERGRDPRDFALLPFGGAGPLHASALARLIGAKTILVPPSPGLLSALGLLVSNLKAEFARTCFQRAGSIDVARVAGVLDELTANANRWLEEEGVPPDARRIGWLASMRYENQGFELPIPWAGSAVDAPAIDRLIEAFHGRHEQLYTFAQRDTPVEIVTLRVDARGVFPAPEVVRLPEAGKPEDARIGTQRVHLASGPVECPIVDRAKLGANAVIEGPAIIAQLDATTLLRPGDTARVDTFGNILVQMN